MGRESLLPQLSNSLDQRKTFSREKLPSGKLSLGISLQSGTLEYIYTYQPRLLGLFLEQHIEGTIDKVWALREMFT